MSQTIIPANRIPSTQPATVSESGNSYRLHLNEAGGEVAVLLNALLETVDGVPSGEALRVAFYYLRNERLCDALARARKRGVDVRILISGRTHVTGANRAAIESLRGQGFESEISVRHDARLGLSRMHLKLLLASRVGERSNVVFTGTYNPSSSDARTGAELSGEEAALLQRIGDQDRGFNYLLEIAGSREAYNYLAAHFDGLHASTDRSGILAPTPPFNYDDLTIQVIPTRLNPLLQYLSQRLASGVPGRLRIAASHISNRRTIALLGQLQTAGHRVEIIGHDSTRRFSSRSQRRLEASGVAVRRYVDASLYPMHCKFILSQYPAEHNCLTRDLFVGSMNLNTRSYYLNDDLFFQISNTQLYDNFEGLWNRISDSISPQPQS